MRFFDNPVDKIIKEKKKMEEGNALPDPLYCAVDGCKLTTVSEFNYQSFDQYTGVGTRRNKIYLQCPKFKEWFQIHQSWMASNPHYSKYLTTTIETIEKTSDCA